MLTHELIAGDDAKRAVLQAKAHSVAARLVGYAWSKCAHHAFAKHDKALLLITNIESAHADCVAFDACAMHKPIVLRSIVNETVC